MIRSVRTIRMIFTLGLLTAGVLLTGGCDGVKEGFNAGLEQSVATVITETVARVFHLD